jgi:hypothetical protein
MLKSWRNSLVLGHTKRIGGGDMIRTRSSSDDTVTSARNRGMPQKAQISAAC